MKLVRKMEQYKAIIQLEDGTILEIIETVSGSQYNPTVNKIAIVHDDNFGPKIFFEYEPKSRKLSEVQTFG